MGWYNVSMAKRIKEEVLRYDAFFEPCDEGGFTVTVPKLPGVVTEGDNFEEAMNNVKDAINGYLILLQEAKEEIPEPDRNSFTASVSVNINQFASS
jgi:predicted RNase H-like HicB family nuclease